MLNILFVTLAYYTLLVAFNHAIRTVMYDRLRFIKNFARLGPMLRCI